MHAEEFPCQRGRQPRRVYLYRAECEQLIQQNSYGIVSLLYLSAEQRAAGDAPYGVSQNESTMQSYLSDGVKSAAWFSGSSRPDLHQRVLHGPVSVEVLAYVYTVEEHIFRAFTEETDYFYRLRLAGLLCALYSRLGYGGASAAAMPHLYVLSVLFRSGVVSNGEVETPGGLVFGKSAVWAHWRGVLSVFIGIRDGYPWKPLWERSFASNEADDISQGPSGGHGSRTVSDALDPWDFHGTYSAKEAFGVKTGSSRSVLSCSSANRFRNRYREFRRPC